MSYHGKLQTLKNGTADAEIQQWAYQQLEKETVELTDEEIISIGEQYWNGAPFKFVDFARAVLRKASDK